MANTGPIQLAFTILIISCLILSVMANSDLCGRVFETQVDHIFVGNLMEKSVVKNEFECQQKCIENESRCKSCNVYLEENNVICELNNKTRLMKAADFKKRRGSTYYGLVQISCINVFHDEKAVRNSGKCHPEYKGKGCLTPVLGWSSRHPALSCKHILEAGVSKGDGEYWINSEKNGSSLKVFCDMTTDGGGWLLIYNVIAEGTVPPTSLTIEKTYAGVSRYSSNRMVLSPKGMRELRSRMSFTQLRFHCRKQQHGRMFHVKTAANSSGEAVVGFFGGDTDVFPKACGSFEKLKGDNSVLASRCAEWGRENRAYHVGKWGHEGNKELYIYSAFIKNHHHWVTWPGHDRWECDDSRKDLTRGDFWKIYVR